MRFTNRYISSLILAAVIASPVAMMAAPGPNDDGVQVRVYDTHHKDYHNWDDHENHAWGVYLTNNHRKNPRILEVQQKRAVQLLELAPFPPRPSTSKGIPTRGKTLRSGTRVKQSAHPSGYPGLKRNSTQEICREMKGGRKSEITLQRAQQGFSLQEISYE